MKLFIWDFHGVLEKGNENAVLEISNLALKKLGYEKEFSNSDIDKYYGLKWYEYFENILPELPNEKHLELEAECIEIQNLNPHIIAKHIRQNDHAEKVISEIKLKHYQILISNTHKEALDMFIEATGLSKYFNEEHVFAANSLEKGDTRRKKDLLSKFLHNAKIIFDEIISIGDSKGDIELVESIPNGKSYLYAHPNRKHKKIKATYKTKDLRDILKEI